MQYIPDIVKNIEALAKTSLYETNRASQVKAEQEFTRLVFQLRDDDHVQLLQAYSEDVVLAFGAVLYKNTTLVMDHIPGIVPKVNQVLAGWYQPNGVFRRQQGDELKMYVENTFGCFMGNSLKLLFRRAETKGLVSAFLDNMNCRPHYRLFLYYRFIESVAFVDNEMSYVEYRTMLTSFQETFIPRIFEVLTPYFITISDNIDINQLALLQSSLSFAEGQQQQPQCVLQFSGKNRFTEVVFQLLSQVISYRYDISHREYQDMEDYENVLIRFPEPVLKEIMRQSFLDALYNILLTLMRTNQFKYQQISLNCLSKILLARISNLGNLKHELETPFFFTNMHGVLRLLSLILANKVTHRVSATHILKCTSNFVRTFGFDNLQQKLNRDERYPVLLNRWFETAKQIPLFILQNDDKALDSQNELFLAAVEMTAEIANELKINQFRYKIEDYVVCYRNLTNAFLNSFLTKGKNILGSKHFSFQELQKAAKEMLDNMKVIATYNYEETFCLLNKCCDYLYNNSTSGEFDAGNLILFINEMIRESRVFEQSIFGRGLMGIRHGEMNEVGGELSIFAQVVTKTLNFIVQYQETGLPNFYLNNSIVVFLCTLLNRWSSRISTGDMENEMPPFIDDELYKRLKILINNSNDEEFLLNCLQALARFIRCPTIRNIDFIFVWLFKIISHIKHNMKRDYFKKTKIYEEMLNVFGTLSLQPIMSVQHMKWRVLLFKIITALSFDDSIDQYRDSIRKTIALLQTSALKGEWAKILYDLTGIFQTIDGRLIFRYFLRKFLKEISLSTLLKELFVGLGFVNPKVYLKDVMHLSWTIVENHNRRIESDDCVKSLYLIIANIIPYWNQYLESDIIADTEDSLLEVYNSFSGLIDGKHINICLLDYVARQDFRLFFKLIIKSMCANLQTLESSAELSEALFTLALLLTDKVIKSFFDMDDSQIAKSIHYFIVALMRKLRSCFDMIVTGSFQENWLDPMLRTIDQYFNFIRINNKKLHLQNLTANIQYVMGDIEEKEIFLETVIKVAMEFRHHFTSPLQLISNISVNLIDFYRLDPENLIHRLGLNDEKDIQELRRIFKHVKEATEDYEWLTAQMKDWLKTRHRFTSVTPDDY